MSDEYSLSDVLERMYENQLGLEAALMELTLHAEKQGLTEVGENVRGALWALSKFSTWPNLPPSQSAFETANSWRMMVAARDTADMLLL